MALAPGVWRRPHLGREDGGLRVAVNVSAASPVRFGRRQRVGSRGVVPCVEEPGLDRAAGAGRSGARGFLLAQYRFPAAASAPHRAGKTARSRDSSQVS
jgi:hypothetical protein